MSSSTSSPHHLHTNTQTHTHRHPNFISEWVTSFARQPEPGLTRDSAWCHILPTAESQHAQEWDQSMPKHKEARYIKPILPQLYPSSSLSLFAAMHARGHGNATEQLGEYCVVRPEWGNLTYSQGHGVQLWQAWEHKMSNTHCWLL